MKRIRQLLLSIVLLLLVIVGGTVGYKLFGGQAWSWLDSFYMTITTITTVGFGEVHDLGEWERLFTIALIIAGVGTAFYVLGSFAQIVIEGQVNEIIGRKRLEKQIQALKNHYIVCGCGRMGSIICRELRNRPVDVVAVDNDEQAIKKMEAEGFWVVWGDATEEEVLRRAGIERAKGILCCLATDADNVYVTLTARELNPNIYILARAGEEGSEQKLRRAGADRVISPFFIGAMRMAHAILRPAVVDFIEMTTMRSEMDLEIEELPVNDKSKVAGKTLRDSNIRQDFDAIIIAVQRPDGQMIFNPASDCVVRPGDVLITLGKQTDVARLAKILNP